MKKLITTALVIVAIASLTSCTAAKKPAPPENNIQIVPEVSSVAYTNINIKEAPKVVQDIAKVMEKRDATAWAQSGNKAYLIVSKGEKTVNYNVEVDEVLQHLPEPEYTWLEAKIAYKKRDITSNNKEPEFLVVMADVANPPEGVGFIITGLDTDPPNPGRPMTKVPAPETRNAQAATIEQPAPNQEIASPVIIRGTVKSQGQKRVRIATKGGQIIKEESLNPVPGSGSFSIEVVYSPPEMPVSGEITIIDINGGDEKVLSRVAVIIK